MTSGDTSGQASEGPPPVRIGTAERTAAMQALNEHLDAGRLGVEEYAERSATAANATVASELAALFTDLPAPHPTLPGVTPPAALVPAVPEKAAVAQRFSSALSGWAPRIVAITPVLALVLFLVTGQWWWFLLIPVLPAVIYGGGAGRHGNDDDDDEGRDGRRAERDRRRDERRDR